MSSTPVDTNANEQSPLREDLVNALFYVLLMRGAHYSCLLGSNCCKISTKSKCDQYTISTETEVSSEERFE